MRNAWCADAKNVWHKLTSEVPVGLRESVRALCGSRVTGGHVYFCDTAGASPAINTTCFDCLRLWSVIERRVP